MELALIILIYISIIFILVIGTLLSITLLRLIKILEKTDNIITYIEYIRGIVDLGKRWPIELAKKILDKLLTRYLGKE